MAVSDHAIKPVKWAAIIGVVLTMGVSGAYAKQTIGSVAPKAGEGAGIGVGGVPLFLQGVGKGLQEMQQNQPAQPLAPVAGSKG